MTRSVETDERSPAQPALGKREATAVLANRVLHLLVVSIIVGTRSHHGVVARIGGIARIDVERLVPAFAMPDAIHLPWHGHRDVVPRTDIEAVGIETGRGLAWQCTPTELPCAVQVEEVWRLRHIQGASIFGLIEGNTEVVALNAVQTGDADIVPFRHRLRVNNKCDETKQKRIKLFHYR